MEQMRRSQFEKQLLDGVRIQQIELMNLRPVQFRRQSARAGATRRDHRVDLKAGS
jgi:hypothetical protein